MFAWRKRLVSGNRSFFMTFIAKGGRLHAARPGGYCQCRETRWDGDSERSFGSLNQRRRPNPLPFSRKQRHPAAPLWSHAGNRPHGPREVDIDLVEPSHTNKTRFREESLDELARSIRASASFNRWWCGRWLAISVNRRGTALAGGATRGLNKVTVIVNKSGRAGAGNDASGKHPARKT